MSLGSRRLHEEGQCEQVVLMSAGMLQPYMHPLIKLLLQAVAAATERYPPALPRTVPAFNWLPAASTVASTRRRRVLPRSCSHALRCVNRGGDTLSCTEPWAAVG